MRTSRTRCERRTRCDRRDVPLLLRSGTGLREPLAPGLEWKSGRLSMRITANYGDGALNYSYGDSAFN